MRKGCLVRKKKNQKDSGSCVGSNWVKRGEDGEEKSERQRQGEMETEMS